MALRLKIIIGSTRPGRNGPTIAHWVEKFAREHGKFDVEVVDLAEVNLPLLDEAAHPSQRLGVVCGRGRNPTLSRERASHSP